MVGHGGSSAGSYLADPTSPIPSHCASIVVTSTFITLMSFDCKRSKINVPRVLAMLTVCISVGVDADSDEIGAIYLSHKTFSTAHILKVHGIYDYDYGKSPA